MFTVRNRLRSEQGVSIAVLYFTEYLVDEKGDEVWLAMTPAVQIEAPPWVLDPTAKVEAVLMPRVFANGGFVRWDTVRFALDLTASTPSTTQFTGTPGFSVVTKKQSQVWLEESDPWLAVVAAGDWQRDPIQGGLHDFRFAWKLDEA